jgi:hypothetical protein
MKLPEGKTAQARRKTAPKARRVWTLINDTWRLKRKWDSY